MAEVAWVSVVLTVIVLIIVFGVLSWVLTYFVPRYGVYMTYALWSVLAYYLWIGAVTPDQPAVASLMAYDAYVLVICAMLSAVAGSVILAKALVRPNNMRPKKKQKRSQLQLDREAALVPLALVLILIGCLVFLYVPDAWSLRGWLYVHHIAL